MKVAYLAESPADQAALKILTEAVLGRKTEPINHAGLAHRGWPAVRTVLPAVIRELHYRSEAEGLVLIVDSNGSPPHVPAHEAPNSPESRCRLCQLRRISSETQRQFRLRTSLPALKVAIGVAVPAIEAWLLCSVDAHINEAVWINGMKEGRLPYTKESLKLRLYGTSHPSLATETHAMMNAATKLVPAKAEQSFPHGLGSLLNSLRSW